VAIPRDFILDALRGRARPAGVLAARDVDRALALAAAREFGSVDAAIIAAGVRLDRAPAPARIEAERLQEFVALFVEQALDLARSRTVEVVARALEGSEASSSRRRVRTRRR
jgi:hypothetical protein